MNHLKDSERESKEDLLCFFYQSDNIIFNFFKTKKIHYSMIITLTELAAECNNKDRILFTNIITALFEIMDKYSNFVIKTEHLKILHKNIVQRGLGNIGFNQFVKTAIKQPEDWVELRKDYLQNERRYLEQKKSKSEVSKRTFEQML